jgi:hypothetical protein
MQAEDLVELPEEASSPEGALQFLRERGRELTADLFTKLVKFVAQTGKQNELLSFLRDQLAKGWRSLSDEEADALGKVDSLIDAIGLDPFSADIGDSDKCPAAMNARAREVNEEDTANFFSGAVENLQMIWYGTNVAEIRDFIVSWYGSAQSTEEGEEGESQEGEETSGPGGYHHLHDPSDPR